MSDEIYRGAAELRSRQMRRAWRDMVRRYGEHPEFWEMVQRDRPADGDEHELE